MAAACANLRQDDYITGTHGGHGHCIAKGARVDRMMAELMGREDGYCRGCCAGKSGKTRKGNRWLRGALVQAALAAGTRSTKGAFAARYRRVMRHRGHQKAVVAVAHAMLVTAYHLLARKTTYYDPGADYYEHRHAERVRHRAVQLLERQG